MCGSTMRSLLFRGVVALAIVSIGSCDLVDNEIEEHPGRQTNRARHAVKMCKPCAANQCQVMGKSSGLLVWPRVQLATDRN